MGEDLLMMAPIPCVYKVKMVRLIFSIINIHLAYVNLSYGV